MLFTALSSFSMPFLCFSMLFQCFSMLFNTFRFVLICFRWFFNICQCFVYAFQYLLLVCLCCSMLFQCFPKAFKCLSILFGYFLMLFNIFRCFLKVVQSFLMFAYVFNGSLFFSHACSILFSVFSTPFHAFPMLSNALQCFFNAVGVPQGAPTSHSWAPARLR